MRNIVTMLRREVGAYFLSPIAYVVLAVFLFTAGMAFAFGVFAPGNEASLRALLEPWMLFILVAVVPVLTMRLLSEEMYSGTIETLLTAPITETQIVLGKFLGAMAFYGILLAALFPYAIIIASCGSLDLTLLLCNGLGLVLVGSLFVAVGLFFSAMTKHQVVAGLLSIVVLAIATFGATGLSQTVGLGWIRVVIQQVSVQTHFREFVRGMLDANPVVFFVTTTALFLFLTVKRLEMRRWQ